MNYPLHGNVTGPHGQVGYAGAGQPPLPMRGGMPHGMQPQQVPSPGYGMPPNVANYPSHEAKGYYASLPPKSQGQGGYGMPPQSPTGLYPPPQGPPGSMAPPQSRGYPPPGMPQSMYSGVQHPGAGMHPSYPHPGVVHTPHTPSSAPQTPVEVPPSPSGTTPAAASTTAVSGTTPNTPNSSATATTTAKRGAKAAAAAAADKPAKATGTRRTSAKAAKEAAAKEAAAAAATVTSPANSDSHQGTAAHTAAQVPMSLPQSMPHQLPNGMAMPPGMMRSITPPPQHMHPQGGDPNGPAAGGWPPHGYPHRWAQGPGGVPQQGPPGMPQQGPPAPGQKPLSMSGSAAKGGHMVPPQLPQSFLPNAAQQHHQHQQSPPQPNHQLHSSRGSQGYNPAMQYPIAGVMANGPQDMHPNGPSGPHLYPGMQHPGQHAAASHGHILGHPQQFAHPHMPLLPQSPAGSIIPSSPHGNQNPNGPPTPQSVQTPPAHLSSLTSGGRTTPGAPGPAQVRRGPTPPSGLPSEAEGSLYPFRPPAVNQLGPSPHPMDPNNNNGSEMDDGLSSVMYPNEGLDDNSNGGNAFGPSYGQPGGYFAPSSAPNGPQPGQPMMSGPMGPYGSHPSHMGGNMPPHMMDAKQFYNGNHTSLDPSEDHISRKRKKPTGGFEPTDFPDSSSPRLSHGAYSETMNMGSSMMSNYGNPGDSIKSDPESYGYGASSMIDMSGADSLVSPSAAVANGPNAASSSSDQKLMTLIDDSDTSANANDNEPLLPAYTPTDVRTMSDHTSKVLVCAFDSTGKYLATGGGGTDAPIRVWDVETGKVHMLLKGHIHNVTGLKWSTNPDRPSLLLSCSLDTTIRLWDINNVENPEIQCVRHTQSLNALDWHPNAHDRFICTDHMEQLVLWYMANEETMEIEKLPAKCIEGVANKQVRYSPCGRFIAAGLLSSPISVLKILDGETQKVLHELSGHDKQIIGLHWIDDSIVVSTSEDIVRVWKITATTAECIQGFSPPGDKTYYAIPHPRSPTRILIGAYQKMYDWDFYSNKSRSTQCHDGIISCLSYSAKSDLLATTSHDKHVNLWRIPTS